MAFVRISCMFSPRYGNANAGEFGMFRWNKEKLIDLACITDITIPEIAERVGLSVSAIEKFYNRNRAELYAARNETSVPECTYTEVMNLWGDGLAQAEIARRLGVNTAVVRRLILSAEYDEEPSETGADAELAALRAAHPNRLYEDDVRALTEYDGRVPVRLLAADTGLRQAA